MTETSTGSIYVSLKSVSISREMLSKVSRFMKDYKPPKQPTHKKHDGECYGNVDCDVFMNGFDCRADCSQTRCGNTMLKTGIPEILWEQKSTKTKGYKIVARQDIKKRAYVGEYLGEIKTEDQHREEMKSRPDGTFYAISLVSESFQENCHDGDLLVVDAANMGNFTRWINHSCVPNLGLVTCHGEDNFPRLVFYAKHEIKSGAELTYDYNMTYYGEDRMICYCSQCILEKREVSARANAVNRPFECRVCKKKFSRKDNLDRHLKVHTAEKSFSCDQCETSFHRSDHLQKHLKTHEDQLSEFQCSQCDKQFSQQRYLDNHVREGHGEKKSFVCENNVKGENHGSRRKCKLSKCGKRFSTKRALERHQEKENLADMVSDSE